MTETLCDYGACNHAACQAQVADEMKAQDRRSNGCMCEELLDALTEALPYVEMAEHDPAYKKGAVTKIAKKMLAAIAKARAQGIGS